MSDIFLKKIEDSRVSAQQRITNEKRKLSEQYFTPARISEIMCQRFSSRAKSPTISVLDPCCGVGNLGANILARAALSSENIEIVLVEKDPELAQQATENFKDFKRAKVFTTDFFDYAKENINKKKFDRIILNPPYSKVIEKSDSSKKIQSILGHKEANLYSAFVACCLKMLSDDGELVAIIPRSFCNGPTFRNFRSFILKDFHIEEIYLFESRKIFFESGVMQEILVIKISKSRPHSVKVTHESSDGSANYFEVGMDKICFAGDRYNFIHIPTALSDEQLLAKMAKFRHTLLSLGCRASTGKVVDFRATKWLRKNKSKTTTPLLYQESVSSASLVDIDFNYIDKPGFLKIDKNTLKLFIPRANYVLIRRISFKESKSRIVCSALLSHQFQTEVIGVENHLNYIWGESVEITKPICLALTLYLSTRSVDQYVRRFSGHTQINASDLNSLPIPSFSQLTKFGLEIEKKDWRNAIELAEKRFFG